MIATFLALAAASSSYYSVLDTGIVTENLHRITMNDRCEIVGFMTVDAESGTGFYWSEGKMKIVKSPTGGGVAFFGINNDGLAVGMMYNDTWLFDKPFTWSNDEGLRPIQDGGAFLEVTDVADDGTLAGTIYDFEKKCFVNVAWKNGAYTRFTDAGIGAVQQIPAINDKGEMVVRQELPKQDHCYRVSPGAEPVMFASKVAPPGWGETGYLNPTVAELNNNGWACGRIEAPVPPGAKTLRYSGAIWLPDNTRIDFLAGVAFSDINDDNMAVGSQRTASWPPPQPSDAVVWTQQWGLQNLNTLVPAGSPRMAVAGAINNKGEILCGAAEQGAKTHWYILEPAKA